MTIQPGRSLPCVLLLLLAAGIVYQLSLPALNSGWWPWPPRFDSEPARIQAKELTVRPGGIFRGRAAILVEMRKPRPIIWGPHFFPILFNKYRAALGNDLMVDAETADIPVLNEYGHWISPPMLALLATAFYNPVDQISRAAQVPRVLRLNLARLLGVSLVVSDARLPEGAEVYHGSPEGHPLYMTRIAGANLGQYSPTRTVVATDAHKILDQLRDPDFDGRTLAVVERPVRGNLVPAEHVTVHLDKGPVIRVSAHSPGTSLLILPFDYSHCLRARGDGLGGLIPVNLSQTGLLIHGDASIEIEYRYGLFSGTACRKQDLERIKALDLENAATGRLFADNRPGWRRTRSEKH